uniref:Uncharacterized protein n=1 Tax=Anguilla anguilla TaxID=7936 RepID=A0A0E9P6E0_ANGAN
MLVFTAGAHIYPTVSELFMFFFLCLTGYF